MSPRNRVVRWITFVFALTQFILRAAVFDIPDGDVQSLIGAILIANTNNQPDIINLASHGVYSLSTVNNTIDGLNGLPSIINDGPDNGILISGNGSILQRGAPPPFNFGLLRILHVGDGGVLELNRATIFNGRAIAPGAGIFNRGRLVLNQCVVSDNLVAIMPDFAADPRGGGIFNAGVLNLNETMIVNNSVLTFTERRVGVNGADAHGGGIYNAKGGFASVVNSCVASNSVHGGDVLLDRAYPGSGRGGGIYNEPGATLEVINSTLSYNLAMGGNGGRFFPFLGITEGGGAVYGGDVDTTIGTTNPIKILNSTIAFNTALGVMSQGGGVLASDRATPFPPVPMLIRNSVVASNHAGLTGDSYPDVRGLITSGGNNLIGNAAGLIGFRPIEDLLGTESNPIDPGIGPLVNNGGSTLTHALLPGSPAINAGSADVSDAPAFDQRGAGFPRIVNGRIDIGAFEVQAATPPVFTSCPANIATTNDPGQCSSSKSFLVTATGRPEPVLVCRLGTTIIDSPFSFPVGMSVVTCTASNTAGTTNCEFTVIVQDTEPPVFTSVQATPSVLWPPNHQLVPVSLTANATDNCGSTFCRIISATSNETDDAQGDGHTAPDIVVTGDLTLKLRAERSGKGSGRVYTIIVGCKDSSDNSSTHRLTIEVPR